MRYVYEGEHSSAFAGAYIEYAPLGWSRSLRMAFVGGSEEEFCAALRRVVRAVHLPLTDGGCIDTPSALTPETLGTLDDVLAGWVSASVFAALAEVAALGNAERRRLLSSRVETSFSTQAIPAAPTLPMQ